MTTHNRILTKIIGRDVYARSDEVEDKRVNKELKRIPKVMGWEDGQTEYKDLPPEVSVALINERIVAANRPLEMLKAQKDIAREERIGREADAKRPTIVQRQEPPSTRPLFEWNKTNKVTGRQEHRQINIPTAYGLRKGIELFAEPLTKNLGEVAGGAFIGQFENPTANNQLRMAVLSKNAYLQYLHGKYKKHGQTINSPNDVMAFGSDAEKKRIIQLQNVEQRAQKNVAQTGFLSGGYAPAIARHSAPRNLPLRDFTQVGTQQSYGAYGPETLSRLGIGQGLRANDPANKFAALGIGLADTDSVRIASILGKAPDPLGQTPAMKLKHFTPDIREVAGKQLTPREKLKQFI